MIGTSINGPTIAAKDTGLWMPKVAMLMAMANSKLLDADVNAKVVLFALPIFNFLLI